MSTVDRQVLDRLSKPHQRVVARVLDERWEEISKECPEREESTCGITGEACTWQNCPKLEAESTERGERL